MNGVLEAILASKERELLELAQHPCVARVAERPRRNVATSLRRAAGQPLRLIAENKPKSPSAGPLSSALRAGERAVRYAEAGASMVSVLCDAPFFGGSWDDVVEARLSLDAAGHRIPVLAKEFILDERQLQEAVASGADAVLLIARILDRATLAELFAYAEQVGLESVVEVATEEELEWATSAGATIIGVNARDLDTLAIDTERAAALLAQIPAHSVPLYLSGLRTDLDVERIARTTAHAALIGETLMREDDPRVLLAGFMSAASAPQS